ncbi:MAG: hypothetical protein LBS68_01900 [Puniceicoccales bacterium]|nr:hypothetical protein [Puniceicoccales bacterium]
MLPPPTYPFRHIILSQLFRLSPRALSEKQLWLTLLLEGFRPHFGEFKNTLVALVKSGQLERQGAPTGNLYRLAERPWGDCMAAIVEELRTGILHD